MFPIPLHFFHVSPTQKKKQKNNAAKAVKAYQAKGLAYPKLTLQQNKVGILGKYL